MREKNIAYVNIFLPISVRKIPFVELSNKIFKSFLYLLSVDLIVIILLF